MPNPLDALRKASTIGGPLDHLPPVTADTPPLPISLAGLGGPVASLVGWAKSWLPTAENVVPGAAQTAGQAMGTSAMGAGDVLNPHTAEVMQRMYQSARPAVQALEDAGTFGGDRLTKVADASRWSRLPGEFSPDMPPGGSTPAPASLGQGAMMGPAQTPAPNSMANAADVAYRRLLGRR